MCGRILWRINTKLSPSADRERSRKACKVTVTLFALGWVLASCSSSDSAGPKKIDPEQVTWERAGSERLPAVSRDVTETSCSAGLPATPIVSMSVDWISSTPDTRGGRTVNVDGMLSNDADHIEQWQYSSSDQPARIALYLRYIDGSATDSDWLEVGDLAGERTDEWYKVPGAPIPAFVRTTETGNGLVLSIRMEDWKMDIVSQGLSPEEVMAFAQRAIAACIDP